MFGAPLWAPLALSLLLVATVNGEGNIGCLFSTGLCMDTLEWCYDDLVFGRCLPSYGPLDDDELYRVPLSEFELSALTERVAVLESEDYRWSDPYTQCSLQGLIWGLRQGVPVPSKTCDHLRAIDYGKEAAPPHRWHAEEEGPAYGGSPQGPPVAHVKFTPNHGGHGSDFADEVYYPPGDGPERQKKDNGDIFGYIPSEESPIEFLPEIAYLNNLNLSPQQIRYLSQPENKHYLRNMMNRFDDAPATGGYASPETANLFNVDEYNVDPIRSWLQKQDLEQLKAALQELREMSLRDLEDIGTTQYITKNRLPGRFSRQYNTPEMFRQGKETRDDVQSLLTGEYDPDDNQDGGVFDKDFVDTDYNLDEPVRIFDDNEYTGTDASLANLKGNKESNLETGSYPEEVNPELNALHKEIAYMQRGSPLSTNELPLDNYGAAGVYTEGGLVYVPDVKDGAESDSTSLLTNLLGGRSTPANWPGFKRRERLDVKKPGPPPEIPRDHPTLYDGINTPNKSPQKKEIASHTDRIHGKYIVDTSFAYVTLKERISSWKYGNKVVTAIREVLQLPIGSIMFSRVDRHEVVFIVNQGSPKNSSTIAEEIMSEEVLKTLQKIYGITVTGSGIGDKTKLPLSLTPILAEASPLGGHVAGFLLGGIGGAILVGVAALLLIRRHTQAKDKLGGLGGPESTSSKDYQDLCRARMAAKGPGGNVEAAQTSGGSGNRIASLSRESDNNSPSSRSSTSSWSEEPALTNMDISTGHMVLSYMEDHLRNKGRLDREWGALCRYEAEPAARSAATAEGCVALNRGGAPLPYDHSRVVLNHLSNEAGLDYINASTISDHDPRAPLYVAAQGPLANTSAHFWQMVWEQGAVVMVMLCRLTENGEAMCHRYWPEEGSEVYHIYEVHLVSEHIWCDDYLVRSFYLKNLRTSETRTVTQFHFLSWPQGGVPSSPRALLEFRRKVNKSYRGRSCPIVVHCSDGAGRTGTYILLDMVLARMGKGAREIDIAATLEHIRDQRADMVSTRGQFEFVLMAVAEEVHAILKALPATAQQEKKDKEKEKDKEKDVEKQ